MFVMESHVSFQVSKVRLNGEMTIRLRLEEGEKAGLSSGLAYQAAFFALGGCFSKIRLATSSAVAADSVQPRWP